MYTYLVSRHCLAEENEYHYYNMGSYVKVGYATAAVHPSGSVTLCNRDFKLQYYNDPDITCVPGCSQPICRAASGEEYARVFWDGTGKHRLQTPIGTFKVTYEKGVYSFFWENLRFAVMSNIREGTPFFHRYAKNPRTKRNYTMALLTNIELPTPLALMMLSFPLLQIKP